MDDKNISRNEIVASVKTIVSNVTFWDDDIIRDLSVLQEDLAVDSMDIIDITLMIEDKFGIVISDDTMHKMLRYTMLDVYNLVERLISEKQKDNE